MPQFDNFERPLPATPIDDIALLREKIDAIEADIAKLLSLRVTLSNKILDIKRKEGVTLSDKQRERVIFNCYNLYLKELVSKEKVSRLVQAILELSSRIQD